MIHESLRIAGQKVACDRHIDVRNPYTGEVVGTVPKASLSHRNPMTSVVHHHHVTLPDTGDCA